MVKSGSDKQNDWAQQIADTWTRKIDAEIETNEFREPGSKYYHIKEILAEYKEKAIAKLETMTSKQIIDMYTRRDMLDNYVITMARKTAESQIKEG
jgi:hypothetical protein